jgi:MFS family permease
MLESPKFYIAQGDTDKAIAILQEMAQRNNRELTAINEASFIDSVKAAQSEESKDSRKGFQAHIKSGLHSLSPLFATPKESLTTTLVILIWTIANLAGTTFYIFLPVFIANHGHLSVNQTYRNYLIQAICALPGTIASHFACNSFLGRKWTMALTAFGTGAFILLFTTSTQPGAQLAFNCVSSFLANLLWGAIYTYTPEVFPVAYRGRGTGLASAISRIIGAFAPFIGGRLIGIQLKFPLYLSVGLYGLLALCAAALPLETRKKARDLK